MEKKMAEKQRLELDLEELFPGKSVEIGGKQIDIRPMGLFQLSVMSRKLKSVFLVLKEEGITFNNFNEKDNLLTIAVVLFEQFPDVLSDITNIHVDDIKNLPIEYGIILIDAALEVNLNSKEALAKNFKSLIGKFQLVNPEKTSKKKSKKIKK